MKKILLWAINIGLGYAASLLIIKYFLGLDIQSSLYLILFLCAWNTYGIYIGSKYGYEGFFASWYAPFIAFDIRICAALLAILSVFGSLVINKSVAWDLSWAIVPLMPLGLVLLTVLPFFKGTPYLRSIALLSTLELYLVLALIVFIFKIESPEHALFEPKSAVHLALLVFNTIAITLITVINIFALRGYEFYQKMSTNQDLTSKLTHKRKLQIAVHEAGHAITYAYFNPTPEQLNIYLYEKAMNINKDSYGLVIGKIPNLKTKDFQEWEMLMTIAGNRSEILVYGQHIQGSASDFDKWQSLATNFLLQHEIAYTEQPSSPAQMQTNKILESKLFERHTKIIDTFLKKNKSILMAIAKQAMVFHSLESHHLKKHFSKVVITNKFPTQASKSFFK
ncbi:hypothetical protein [Acinetobacter sp. P1(2025)]|uniref:hypothetical protein n=1 Tax=Acinetobacter sp. P1(2025) TaxID=3446120 RepID=UPI003F52DFFB